MKSSKKSDQYFWKENFEEFTDVQAQRYHEGVTGFPFNEHLYDRLMESLLEEQMAVSGKQILDAGGGTGKWSVYFAERGHKVTLLDVSQAMLDQARMVVAQAEVADKVAIDLGTITALPYADDSFDLVFSDRNPISHCGKGAASHGAIKELARVLRPGGTLIGSVLNKDRKVAQMVTELDLDRAAALMQEGDLLRSDQEHSHYYSRDELEQALRDAGFTNIRILGTTIFTEWIPTAWLLSEKVIDKLYQLEKIGREQTNLVNYGVRFHFIAS